MADQSRYKAQLKSQLGSIERSCVSFDAGFRDEAKRIATTIRVLVRDTSSSTSLLTHLGANSVKLLSTCMLIVEPPEILVFDGLTSRTSAGFIPKLGKGRHEKEMTCGDWWAQLVLIIRNARFTRKRLVLEIANKDGGSHVDANLTPDYEQIVNNFWFQGAVGAVATPFTETHLLSIRQLGYEVLNSPELLNLWK